MRSLQNVAVQYRSVSPGSVKTVRNASYVKASANQLFLPLAGRYQPIITSSGATNQAREVEAALARRLAPGRWHETETEACAARARHRAARAVGRPEEEAAREARLAAIVAAREAACATVRPDQGERARAMQGGGGTPPVHCMPTLNGAARSISDL